MLELKHSICKFKIKTQKCAHENYANDRMNSINYIRIFGICQLVTCLENEAFEFNIKGLKNMPFSYEKNINI